MDLSVVILSYNTRQMLEDCLRSVSENVVGLQAEVFVVDSGSTDGSVELVRRQFPTTKLILTDCFRGFAHANNLALRRAVGRFQLLLNSDTVLPPGALRELIGFMEREPRTGVVGAKLVRGDGTLDLACRRSFPTPEVAFYRLLGLSALFPRSRRFGRYNLTFLDPDEIAEVDSVCGAFMLARKTAIGQVGLLDESFFFYGEDLDWAFRFKQRGWKVVYYPKVQVLHYKGSSSRHQTRRMIHEFYEAMRLFYGKHYASQNSWLVRRLVLLGIALSELRSRLKNRLRPPRAKRVSV